MTLSQPSLLPGLNFTPKFSMSSLPAMQGDGEWGLQSVHNSLLLLSLHVLHLLQHGLSPMGYGSSWTSPCIFSSWKSPEWVSPSGCSPSGTEFPRASQVLSAKSLPGKHLSASCSFLLGPYSSTGFPRAAVSGWLSASLRISMRQSSSWVAEESLLHCLDHLLPLLHLGSWCLQNITHIYLSLLSPSCCCTEVCALIV